MFKRGLMVVAMAATLATSAFGEVIETDNTNTNNTTVNSTTNNTTNTTSDVTSNNTNTNTNTNINTSTSTATNTNNNTNVNTSTVTSDNTNTNINTSTSVITSNNNNVNTNNTNVTENSTINSTSNNTNTNTNTNNNTSVVTSNNTNTNNNNNTSNVTSNNTNNNNNNNTNRNYNESKVTQEIKSPPPSAIAPSISATNIDLCTVGVSGAVQTQILGISGGATVRDMNCERLKLSKTLYDMGMKVAAVSVMCQDKRVFEAMEMAGTPCPYEGKIGEEAKVEWELNPEKSPVAKEEEGRRNDTAKGWLFGMGTAGLLLLLL